MKVYGQAAIGAPPMSVPHLDARVIDGTRHLMFGPYAGFSPKFLKTGSWLDLPSSVKPYNVLPMLGVAKDNVPLEKYLVSELFRSSASQFEALQRFYPSADPTQWTKIVAGQRVQVIKRRGRTGVLQFGTEVVSSADGRIAGLLGASPGASTAVAIMLKVIRLCFADRLDAWQTELARLIPSSQASLADDPDAARRSLEWTTGVLGLSR